jgi:hypothetical protein
VVRLSGERPLRVLHCPADVGGHPGGLARAEREVGLDSWAVSLEPVHDGYEIDEVLWQPDEHRLRRELRRWQLLRRAREADVVHFNFGSPILPRAFPAGFDQTRLGVLFRLYGRVVELRDVAWLARAGKAIAVTFQGDDARQADWCRTHFEISAAAELGPTPTLAALDERRRDWIRGFDRHADRINALNPDLLRVLSGRARFLPYAHVDLREWRPSPPAADGGRPLKVVHAPSDPVVKGTRFVEQAVERLRSDGIPIELLLVLLDGSRALGLAERELPVALGARRTAVRAHCRAMAGRQHPDAGEERAVVEGVLEREVLEQARQAHLDAEGGVLEERLDLRAEQQLRAGLRVVERLDPVAVTRHEQLPGPPVPEREGEHAVEALDARRPPLLVGVDDDLAVGSGAEAVTCPL